MKAARYYMLLPQTVLNRDISLEAFLMDHLQDKVGPRIQVNILHEKYIQNGTLIGITRFVEDGKLAVYFIIDDSIAQEFPAHVNNSRTTIEDITTECVLLDLNDTDTLNLLAKEGEYSKSIFV